ncbi:MAG: hypothetical protein IJA10_07085 [Lachnospiraceae bacterium]|nr:hypothetical protein [Lachnospiraceae bacterium]
MRKKKLVSALLICMLALTGCGGNKNTDSKRDSVLDHIDEKDKVKTETQDENTEDDRESDEDEGKETENAVAPKIEIQGEFVEDRYHEDGKLSLCNLTYSTLGVSDNEYPELSDAFAAWSDERQNELTSLLDEYALMASENTTLLEEYLEYEYHCMFSIYQSLEVERADSRVVSLLEYTSTYTASENDILKYTGLNFDTENGNMLSLSDILDDEEGFYLAATDYIIEDLKETQIEYLIPGYEEKVADMWNGNVSWYLDATGVTIVLNPGEADEIVSPSANYNGIYTTLPYSEFSEFLSEKYAGNQHKGIARLCTGETCLLETSNGMIDVSVELQTNYDMGLSSSIIHVGDSEVKIGEFSYTEAAYIMKRNDDRVFLIITSDYMSDDYLTSLYEITDGTIKFCDEIPDASLGGATINTEMISLNVHLNTLGSYVSKAEYEIDENGKFYQIDKMFHIGSENPANNLSILTTIQELPVVIDGIDTMLPAGSRISVTGTDNVSVITFYDVDTKQEGEIHFERGKGEDFWMIYINGCFEDDYFEYLPYAG